AAANPEVRNARLRARAGHLVAGIDRHLEVLAQRVDVPEGRADRRTGAGLGSILGPIPGSRGPAQIADFARQDRSGVSDALSDFSLHDDPSRSISKPASLPPSPLSESVPATTSSSSTEAPASAAAPRH